VAVFAIMILHGVLPEGFDWGSGFASRSSGSKRVRTVRLIGRFLLVATAPVGRRGSGIIDAAYIKVALDLGAREHACNHARNSWPFVKVAPVSATTLMAARRSWTRMASR
jgi:hypothetical protein